MVLWIALGAVTGASARYFVGSYVPRILPTSFPYGTLLINFQRQFPAGFLSDLDR